MAKTGAASKAAQFIFWWHRCDWLREQPKALTPRIDAIFCGLRARTTRRTPLSPIPKLAPARHCSPDLPPTNQRQPGIEGASSQPIAPSRWVDTTNHSRCRGVWLPCPGISCLSPPEKSCPLTFETRRGNPRGDARGQSALGIPRQLRQPPDPPQPVPSRHVLHAMEV